LPKHKVGPSLAPALCLDRDPGSCGLPLRPSSQDPQPCCAMKAADSKPTGKKLTEKLGYPWHS